MNVKRLLTAFLLMIATFVSANEQSIQPFSQLKSPLIATNAARIATRMLDNGKETSFDITATVVIPPTSQRLILAVEDASGGVGIVISPDLLNPVLQVGDRVHIVGAFARHSDTVMLAYARQLNILSHGPAPLPKIASLAEVASGKHNRQLSKFTGTITDAFRDEIDPAVIFFVLSDGLRHLYATISTHENLEAKLRANIGAQVSVTGICAPCLEANRCLMGRIFHMQDLNAITILRPPPADPFDVQDVSDDISLNAAQISGLGRRRMTGRVIASWQGNMLLLRRENGTIARVELAESPTPTYGDFIEAVGIPETDLYRINLSRAIWRKHDHDMLIPETATAVTAHELTTDNSGKTRIQPHFHGRAVRIEGIVRSIPRHKSDNGQLLIDNDGTLVTVDASGCRDALTDILVDSRVSVSGTCVMDIDNWRPNAVFPRIRGFRIVVRTPEDVEIIAHPPWWTPARLVAVIGSLLAALVAFAVWTVLLRRLAERRGRQLAEEEVAHLGASLRVEERTRLAVELHDSISQNLTAVALEIKAGHNDVAQQTLKSCREELRNCLWDLRHNTLGIADMNEAIRQTLKPQIGETALAVRFFIDRKLIPDNVAHMILKIIRELAVNAVRHGRATALKVAGSIEDGRLLFSVADNGCGFDPDTAPGPAQGHFGLLGVRERIEGAEGELDISSTPGKGTKVTISIKIPKE